LVVVKGNPVGKGMQGLEGMDESIVVKGIPESHREMGRERASFHGTPRKGVEGNSLGKERT
jgi:hypothetical protein